MIDDQILVKQVQEGNRNAFRQLVERYKERIYYMALNLLGNRADAEDMSQEVFIKAFQSIERFRGDAKFSSWLYRITVNTCIDYRRKKWWKIKKAQQSTDLEGAPMIDRLHTTDPDPEQITESRLIQNQLQTALNRLSRRERDIFILRHDHDLALQEIADALHISTGTVKSTLFNAFRKLRVTLAPLYHELDLEV